ncbi:MAG: acyl-CoA dehydratase activase [Bacillota bacterium]
MQHLTDIYLGIDVGSVSTNVVAIDSTGNVLSSVYTRTRGQPIQAIQRGLAECAEQLFLLGPPDSFNVRGVGTTGSARQLASVVAGADVVKNEITAHAVAASHFIPDVSTIIEIGGQDSKIIILRGGIVSDFAMNTVCAAGTGSFLDQQASRLGMAIEDFGPIALKSKNPVRIAGRCTVFAESDMIHKQQMGHAIEDILAGLCEAIVRNYLNNVGRGKDIQPPLVFQGGVAANVGVRAAFEKALGMKVTVPEHFAVMGALGAALLAAEEREHTDKPSAFLGFQATEFNYEARSFECDHCPNTCEIVEILREGSVVARWGSRCLRWEVRTS